MKGHKAAVPDAENVGQGFASRGARGDLMFDDHLVLEGTENAGVEDV